MDKLSVLLLQEAGRERKCKSTRVCMCATERTGLIMSLRLNRRLPLVDRDVMVHTFVGLLQC